jgi:hypothetical protein
MKTVVTQATRTEYHQLDVLAHSKSKRLADLHPLSKQVLGWEDSVFQNGKINQGLLERVLKHVK